MKDTIGHAGRCHAVTFHDTDESLGRTVAEYIGQGLIERQPALVITTGTQRAAILAELQQRYIDVDRAQTAGDMLLLDATEFLTRFIVGGMPDADLFNMAATAAINHLLRGRTECQVRSFGTMVSELWRAGNTAGAVRLEMLWNVLADSTSNCSLLCAYLRENFTEHAANTCIVEQHSHLIISNKALWLTQGPKCPVCGTDNTQAQNAPGRDDHVRRCQFCSAELIDVASACIAAASGQEFHAGALRFPGTGSQRR